MADYKLNFTAAEIDEKLSSIDNKQDKLTGTQGQVVGFDTDGNAVAQSVAAIIDVIELPTENINEKVFYRLITAKFVSTFNLDDWVCYCVDGLPSVGKPVSVDMVNITGYYNIQDGNVYGYADSNISAAGGVPVGWYLIEVLAQAFNADYGGIITDADDIDDSAKLLLKYDFYIYQDDWCKVPFAYEKMPEFDFQWDGDSTGKFVLDMSSLGFTGISITKISDQYLTVEQLLGSTIVHNDNSSYIIVESDIDASAYTGGITVREGGQVVSIYSADDANAVLGLPSGYLTNGLYFFYNSANGVYVSRLVAPSKITKIDSKFLSIDTSALDNLAPVATTGNYNDLYNKPTIYTDVIRYNTSNQGLSSTYKANARTNIDVYSKSEVNTRIENVITYNEQSLTEEQKLQTRENIDASCVTMRVW